MLLQSSVLQGLYVTREPLRCAKCVGKARAGYSLSAPGKFGMLGLVHTTPSPPLHPKPLLHPRHSSRTYARVAFLRSRACPSVLSRLGRVLPVGCDDLESMDCTETALQPAYTADCAPSSTAVAQPHRVAMMLQQPSPRAGGSHGRSATCSTRECCRRLT